MRKYLIGALCAVMLIAAVPAFAGAQQKSFVYPRMDFQFSVNEDSTVDVVETEQFRFVGNFHKAFRTIEHDKVDAITDIRVIDALTGDPLQESSSQLDPLSPDSWGSYTTYTQNGATAIEWYYNLADTDHSWIIQYTLHGSISFLEGSDELYWNLFTDFPSAIDMVSATVVLPRDAGQSLLKGTVYSTYTHEGSVAEVIDGRTVRFAVSDVKPQEDITIAAGWPKGIVSKGAYFRDLMHTWWQVILGIIILLASIVFAYVYWLKTERWGKGRGTIVPQYEPPQDLAPAMVGVLVKEEVSKKTWPATLVDLAIRGYVTIEEDKPNKWAAAIGRVASAAILFAAGFILVSSWDSSGSLVIYIILGIVVIAFLTRLRPNVNGKAQDYTVIRKRPNDEGLKEFEALYLEALFISSSGTFSTKELRASPTKGRALYQNIKLIEKKLYKEVEQDTGAYERKLSKEKMFKGGLSIIGFIILWFMLAGAEYLNRASIFYALLAISALIIAWFVFFESRLTHEGTVMREEWLGFKMYLNAAERYRLQNLTPELFEKYLPYAMVFGIEKKWAKAFEGIATDPPRWYHSYGGMSHGSPIGSSGNSFSAGAFSASLSSSFSSAIGSSGAGGGASGGGGGAGGGGGGGGGGAS